MDIDINPFDNEIKHDYKINGTPDQGGVTLTYNHETGMPQLYNKNGIITEGKDAIELAALLMNHEGDHA